MKKLFTTAGALALSIGALFAADPYTAPFPNIDVKTNANVRGNFSSASSTQTNVQANGFVATGASVAIPPTIATQSGTNFVANFAAGGWQLVTCTNDLYVTMSNPAVGLSVLVEFYAGTTNRNISFDTNYVWMSAKPTVISSNHFMWVNLVAATNNAAGIRATACQSVP